MATPLEVDCTLFLRFLMMWRTRAQGAAEGPRDAKQMVQKFADIMRQRKSWSPLGGEWVLHRSQVSG